MFGAYNFDGISWDECRAAARVLRPGAVRLHAPTSEPLFTPGVSAWAVLGGRCHDTVYSTTCGRIKKNAHPGASLLASLLPSLLILEEKEGEKQGWGAFPSTFFLFDHMWSNKRCHDT